MRLIKTLITAVTLYTRSKAEQPSNWIGTEEHNLRGNDWYCFEQEKIKFRANSTELRKMTSPCLAEQKNECSTKETPYPGEMCGMTGFTNRKPDSPTDKPTNAPSMPPTMPPTHGNYTPSTQTDFSKAIINGVPNLPLGASILALAGGVGIDRLTEFNDDPRWKIAQFSILSGAQIITSFGSYRELNTKNNTNNKAPQIDATATIGVQKSAESENKADKLAIVIGLLSLINPITRIGVEFLHNRYPGQYNQIFRDAFVEGLNRDLKSKVYVLSGVEIFMSFIKMFDSHQTVEQLAGNGPETTALAASLLFICSVSLLSDACTKKEKQGDEKANSYIKIIRIASNLITVIPTSIIMSFIKEAANYFPGECLVESGKNNGAALCYDEKGGEGVDMDTITNEIQEKLIIAFGISAVATGLYNMSAIKKRLAYCCPFKEGGNNLNNNLNNNLDGSLMGQQDSSPDQYPK